MRVFVHPNGERDRGNDIVSRTVCIGKELMLTHLNVEETLELYVWSSAGGNPFDLCLEDSSSAGRLQGIHLNAR